MIELALINEDKLTVPDILQFQHWLKQVADTLQHDGEVCIKLVSEAESQDLNLAYRGMDKPTNVLSFPSEVPDFVESSHLGDLAVCAAVVVNEAIEQNKPVEHHWAHMTIHGMLHLLGYDHINAEDAEEMETLEITLLAGLSIPNPYVCA